MLRAIDSVRFAPAVSPFAGTVSQFAAYRPVRPIRIGNENVTGLIRGGRTFGLEQVSTSSESGRQKVASVYFCSCLSCRWTRIPLFVDKHSKSALKSFIMEVSFQSIVILGITKTDVPSIGPQTLHSILDIILDFLSVLSRLCPE